LENEDKEHVRRNGCIGPSSREEEALACRASLRCHVDSALLRSVSLIETALQCETVAENPWCQVPAWDLSDCPMRQTYSRRDVLGCSRAEKNGSTTSKKKTVAAT
jgi:hypothetical protein